MPLPSSPCQRCGVPTHWRVVDDMPAPFEADGTPHRERCEVHLAWGQARSVDTPQLIQTVATGYVIGIDLETTGIPGRIENPEIVELAAALLRLDDGAILETFTQLVKPRGPLLAVEVHQITADMLKGAPYIEEAIENFNRWRRNMQATYQQTPIPLVSHNAAFELSFLDPCDVEGPWICTLVMSQTMASGRRPRGFHSLGSIVERSGLTYQGEAHRALPDAMICAEVYWLMIQRARIWADLVQVACERLGEIRNSLYPSAPVTAALLLDIEKEMLRRLRLFQDRPRKCATPPKRALSHIVPWAPPEPEPPWPYRFHDALVFEPLPKLLAVVRRVYRAERMGMTLSQLNTLRAAPEFAPVDPRAEAPPAPPPPEEPARQAPHQPSFPSRPTPPHRGQTLQVAAPVIENVAPHKPNFPKPGTQRPRARLAPAAGPSRSAPVQPDFPSRPRAQRPTASDGRPPPRAESSERAKKVAPIKPTFGRKG